MAGHAVEGLIKWLRRDEWRAAFEDLMDEHLGDTCDEIDGSLDDLTSLLGSEAFIAVWGCAFEDFLTREAEDGANIVDDYLKRRGLREPASSRAYMKGLRNSVMSLYEVSDVRPGESFLARDLIRGGEPVRVSERRASRDLKLWDRIAARLVKVGPKTVMGGGVLPFDHTAADDLIEALRELRADSVAPDEEAFESDPLGSNALTDMAPVFTSAWLADRIQAVLYPPELTNTDGHELVFTTVRYPLLSGAQEAEVGSALDRSPELVRVSATSWTWIDNASTEAQDDGSFAIGSTTADGYTVLGSMELEDQALMLNVNSVERAELGQALLEPLLERLVGAPEITCQTLDDLEAGESAEDAAEFDDLDALPPDWIEQYYRRLLDEPVPMLGDSTPRQAAKEAGRADELAAWLKFLENRMARTAGAGPDTAYDLSWMWGELGIADLRR